MDYINEIYLQAIYILPLFSFSKWQDFDEFDSNDHTQTGVHPKCECKIQRLFQPPQKKKQNKSINIPEVKAKSMEFWFVLFSWNT